MENRELVGSCCGVLGVQLSACDDLGAGMVGGRKSKRVGCIHVANSLHYAAETNTIL